MEEFVDIEECQKESYVPISNSSAHLYASLSFIQVFDHFIFYANDNTTCFCCMSHCLERLTQF